MKEIATKTTGSSYTADEFEDRDTELENSVERSGQTLNQSIDIQLARAMSITGVASQTFQDSGSVNAVELTPITGTSGLVVPENYTQLSGGIVEFYKAAPNTSATVTVNIGQDSGSYLGAKNLKQLDGSTPGIGEVTGWLRVRFDFANDWWVILGTVSAAFLSLQITSNYSIPTPDTANRTLNVDATAGDITITFPTVVLGDISKKLIVYKAVDVANEVILTGLFIEDYKLDFGEVVIASTQEITTGVYAWIVEKQDSQTKTILEQNDFESSILQPDNSILFEFSSTNFVNSAGDIPISLVGIEHKKTTDTINRKFTNRGFLYNNNGFIEYGHSWGNAGFIRGRIKPGFDYTIALDQALIDSASGGASTDYILLKYDATTDKFLFRAYVDGGNNIIIETDAFTDNPSLQQWFDIVLTWDKNNNDDADGKGNASFYLNGIEQGAGAEGLKTKNGTGISSINITGTILTLMNFNRVGSLYSRPGCYYFEDWLFGAVWNEETTNYDGGSVKPNFNYNRVGYLNHNALIDDIGNAGYQNLFIKNLFFMGSSIFGEVSFENIIAYKAKKIESSNFIHNDSISRGDVYDVLKTLIPNTSDKILINGGIYDTAGIQSIIINYAIRTDATNITIYGLDVKAPEGVTSIVLPSGHAGLLKVSISW